MPPYFLRDRNAILDHVFPRAKKGLACLAATLVLAAGCEKGEPRLEVADLTPGELVYVQRVVVLERARAVALMDEPLGEAILDSLASAWGDSSLERTIELAPAEPERAVLVNDLLLRILEAEEDSLMEAPRADRIARPLPDPAADPEPEDR
ncbi:MAG: hypothetical protein AB7V45_13915 [Candidatus Krumholzibacteriia bacterium]